MADIFIQHFRAHFLIWKLFHIDWNFIIIFLWGKSYFTKYWWHSLLTHIYASLNIRLLTHICQQVQLVNLHNFVSLTCEMQVHLSFSMLSAISSENISCIWYEISSNSTSLHETNQHWIKALSYLFNHHSPKYCFSYRNWPFNWLSDFWDTPTDQCYHDGCRWPCSRPSATSMLTLKSLHTITWHTRRFTVIKQTVLERGRSANRSSLCCRRVRRLTLITPYALPLYAELWW